MRKIIITLIITVIFIPIVIFSYFVIYYSTEKGQQTRKEKYINKEIEELVKISYDKMEELELSVK